MTTSIIHSLFQYPAEGAGVADWQPWSHNGVQWYIAPEAPDDLRERLANWNHPSCPDGNTVVLKQDRCRNVTAHGNLVMKTMYPRPGVWSRMRFAVRPSFSRRACRLALGLRAAGVPVVEPLAYGRRQRAGLTDTEITVTARLHHTDTLSVWLRRKSSRHNDILAAYGALMGAFHARGFSNRDLKDENVLCLNDDPISLWVADMDGVRYCRRISRFRCARDWRALVRSLAICGCADETSLACILEGYNATVPSRLRWRRQPWFSEQARRR